MLQYIWCLSSFVFKLIQSFNIARLRHQLSSFKWLVVAIDNAIFTMIAEDQQCHMNWCLGFVCQNRMFPYTKSLHVISYAVRYIVLNISCQSGGINTKQRGIDYWSVQGRQYWYVRFKSIRSPNCVGTVWFKKCNGGRALHVSLFIKKIHISIMQYRIYYAILLASWSLL